MSKTVFISAFGKHIMTYDVAFSVLLKLLSDDVESDPNSPWSPKEVECWREHAYLGANFAMSIGDGWTEEQIGDLTARLDRIARSAERGDLVFGPEVASWRVSGDQCVIWRGDDPNLNLHVLSVAGGIAALLRRELVHDGLDFGFEQY